MHPHIHHTPQSRPPLPGLTSAVRSQWQSIGNAGVVCQVMAWALCRFAAEMGGRSYGLIVSFWAFAPFWRSFTVVCAIEKSSYPFQRAIRCVGMLAFLR